jgi:hypothetical protein
MPSLSSLSLLASNTPPLLHLTVDVLSLKCHTALFSFEIQHTELRTSLVALPAKPQYAVCPTKANQGDLIHLLIKVNDGTRTRECAIFKGNHALYLEENSSTFKFIVAEQWDVKKSMKKGQAVETMGVQACSFSAQA